MSTPSPPLQLLIGLLLVALGTVGRPIVRVFFDGIDDGLSGGRTLRPDGRTESDREYARARLAFVSIFLVVAGSLTAGVGLLHLIF